MLPLAQHRNLPADGEPWFERPGHKTPLRRVRMLTEVGRFSAGPMESRPIVVRSGLAEQEPDCPKYCTYARLYTSSSIGHARGGITAYLLAWLAGVVVVRSASLVQVTVMREGAGVVTQAIQLMECPCSL